VLGSAPNNEHTFDQVGTAQLITRRVNVVKLGLEQFRSSLSVLMVITILVMALPVVRAADEPVTFTEVARSGIAWPDYVYRESAWGGGAWGDYDGDGWLDIGLPNHPSLTSSPPEMHDSAVMHNNGDGTFTNVIDDLGIELQEDWHDIAWVDYDDDGDLDLWRSVGGRAGEGDGPSSLSRQNADGSFTEVAVEAGVDYPRGRGRGTVWFDYDLDGDLDMYFTGAESEVAPNTMFRNNLEETEEATFTNVGQVGTSPFIGANSQVSVADYDMDGDEDLIVTGYSPGTTLYRNDEGTFVDANSSAGITTEGGGQATAWGDYDNDGDLDLFISRGTAQSMDYFEVWNPPTNTEMRFSASASSGDEDGLDFQCDDSVTFELQRRVGGNIYRDDPFTLGPGDVSDPPSSVDGEFRVWQDPQGSFHLRWMSSSQIGFSGIITGDQALYDISEYEFEVDSPVSIPNLLYRNDGDGTFTEVGSAAGVADEQDCRGADWGDFDNDGDLDLFVQTAGTVEANAPNRVYRNNGDGTFTDMAAAYNVEGTDEGNGWGGSWGDYDNDGDLDLFTHQENWPWPMDLGGYELHRNGGNDNHWIKIELQGLGLASGGSNRDGNGAKVWVTAGEVTRYRPVHDNSHYMHHYNGPIHVGLDDLTVVDEIRVLWPSGTEQFRYDVPADQVITITEGAPPTADLEVVKSDATDPVTEGDDVTYTVTVTNGGPDTAENVVLTDDLPDGVTFVSATPDQGSCSQSGGVVTCELGDLANGADTEVTIVVNAPTAGTLTNSASASSDTADPNSGNDSDTETTEVEEVPVLAADLSVSKSDAADPVAQGDNITYTVTVTNGGPDTAENVVLTDDLPDGVTFVSATPDQGSCGEMGDVVTCDLGDLANGADAEVTIVVNAPTAGTLTNSASVSSDTADPNSGNDSDTETTEVEEVPVLAADLSVSKSDAADPVSQGDDITYTVTVTNGGPDTAENVVLTDDLPDGVNYVSATPDQGTCSQSGGVVTCELGEIADGTSVDVTIVVETVTYGTLTNAASVSADTDDPNAANDNDSEETTVIPGSCDLGVSKRAAPDPVTVGDLVSYTIDVQNDGPGTAAGVVLTDDLPSGLAYVSATAEQGSCSESSGVVTCDLGNIDNGDSVRVRIVVEAVNWGMIVNLVEVTSSTSESDVTNNTASEPVTIDPIKVYLPLVLGGQ
jgi:uncharacterized repeat protein (TIGR01451 family)